MEVKSLGNCELPMLFVFLGLGEAKSLLIGPVFSGPATRSYI